MKSWYRILKSIAGIRNVDLGIVEVFGGISGILLTLLVVPVRYILLNRKENFIYKMSNSLFNGVMPKAIFSSF